MTFLRSIRTGVRSFRQGRWTLAVAAGVAGIAYGAPAGQAVAADVTAKFHHMLPPMSTAHRGFIAPWAKKIETASGGRIKINIFHTMQLGGKPPQLFDQAREGVADIVWALQSYTPGRFPVTAAFELPFMVDPKAEVTSQALHAFIEKHAMAEYSDVVPLAFHAHAGGAFHVREKGITKQADLQGMKIRGPSRAIGSALKLLGATPLFMPIPEVPVALSKGVMDATVIPFEVVPPFKIQQLVKFHSTVEGDRGLYSSTFMVVMNKAAFEKMPKDLQKIVTDNAGMKWSKEIGHAFDVGEAPGLKLAHAAKNTFTKIPAEEAARWRKTVQPVVDEWVAEMNKAGKNGAAMLKDANDLLDKYKKM